MMCLYLLSNKILTDLNQWKSQILHIINTNFIFKTTVQIFKFIKFEVVYRSVLQKTFLEKSIVRQWKFIFECAQKRERIHDNTRYARENISHLKKLIGWLGFIAYQLL